MLLRINVLLALMLGVMLSPIMAEGQEKALNQEKYNVLFIMTDQQSNNMMSCTGNEYLHTPNLDKLAERGYRFDKTYVTNPVCSPSRFSIMTGHYSSEVGIKENIRTKRPARFSTCPDEVQKRYIYDPEKVEKIKEHSWGNIFLEAGYKTIYSGKRHLYGDFSNYGFKSYGKDPFDGPAIFAEKYFSEIDDSNQDKPFLMFLSFMEPHGICYHYRDVIPESQAEASNHYREVYKTLSREEYLEQIPPRKTKQPISDEHPDMNSFVSFLRHWDLEWDYYNWIYHRLTEIADEQIGRVLKALKKADLEKNTIVIFTSDHGNMQGAHGLKTKSVMYEEAQRVPFIFAGPGIEQNVVDESTLMCNGLDLLPTDCDLIGIEVQKDLEGITLKPYLTGSKNKPQREYIITESFNSFQITDGRYKYTIYEVPENPEMLVDLEINPEETINFSEDPKYKEIKEYLKDELMTNLSKKGISQLPQNRQIENIWPTRMKN